MSTSLSGLESPFSERTVTGEGFAEAWRKLIWKVSIEGLPVVARGKRTKELLGVKFIVKDMAQNILVSEVRNLNYKFMVAEWLWILAGRDDVEFLAQYVKKMRDFSDDGKTLAGAYGPRLITQWEYVRQTLEADKGSRQAVASIWTPNPEPSLDIPCTLNLQWFLRDGYLHCIVNMRSSDTWLGLPYDFFTFSMLSMDLASDLGASVGSLQMNLGSSHLYEKHFEVAGLVPYDVKNLRVPPFNDTTVYRFSRVLSSEDALKTLEEICRDYR
jgi:thymidylate synthase